MTIILAQTLTKTDVPNTGAIYDHGPETQVTVPTVVEVEVNFGSFGQFFVPITTTVTGCSWVTSTTLIAVSPSGGSTTDRTDKTDAAIDGVHGYATNVVAGVGFDLICWSHFPTHGKFKFSCIGI